MEEIKGMSDAEARRWLQKHGYGVGDIEMIVAGEDPTADDVPPPPVVAKPAPKPVKKAEAKPVKVAVKVAPKTGM